MTTAAQRPVYDSATSRGRMIDAIADLPRYRYFLRLLIATNIKTRYKRSLLGVAWTLLNPLLHTVVLMVAFSALFGDRLPNYPIYVLTGVILFDFFRQTTSHSMNQLVWGSGLLAKVYLPSAVFPLSALGTGAVNLGVNLLPVTLIMAVMHHQVTWAILFIPVAVLLLSLFCLGVGLLLASLAISFTDVAEMWGVLVRAWYFLTPIMYPETILPPRIHELLVFNPLLHLLRCFRDPIYLGLLPPGTSIAAATGVAAAALLAGWWTFSQRQHEFALRA